MKDNSITDNKSLFDFQNIKGSESFVKNLSEFSKEIPNNNYTININSQEHDFSFISEIGSLCEDLVNVKVSNQNKDLKQLIKIKDENYLESGIKIETFLNSISDINDDKFQKCELCKINGNIFFCSICNKHFCENCYIICQKNMHIIKDLNSLKINVENYKK